MKKQIWIGWSLLQGDGVGGRIVENLELAALWSEEWERRHARSWVTLPNGNMVLKGERASK